MKRCPITYDSILASESYSKKGLSLLSPQLTTLQPLPLSAAEQRDRALALMGKMSIQGVQLKLSARLNNKQECFDIVEQQGQYILKPPHAYYPELPENEALTMSLAAIMGIEVPIHGLVYAIDNSRTYFIKRFDRKGLRIKFAVEDFAQLSQHRRDTKYNSSMEKVAKIVEDYCSFPKVECLKLLKLTLFNFLIGNEDMHLKNFTLITHDNKISLAPAYDLLNTSIAQKNTKEELALPLNGKKNNLKKADFLDYYAIKTLKLSKPIVEALVQQIKNSLSQWNTLISHSFLSEKMQQDYLKLLNARYQRLIA